MKQSTFDIAIIGAGIVGCALARHLSTRFKKIVLIEKENRPAEHTSGRNSGVIHSGMNPAPGTLKAELCVEGSRLTRAYCKENKIPCEEVGTHVVAQSEGELPQLQHLKARGDQNGVPGLQILSAKEYRQHEPKGLGVASLFSPTGAIVDSSSLTRTLAQQAQAQGVVFEFNKHVTGMEETSTSLSVNTPSETFDVGCVINCAGLQADRMAHYLGVGTDYAILPFRGEYFVLDAGTDPLVRSMIYPLPDLRFPFLGIHLTRTTGNQILVGPNAVPAGGREAYDRNTLNWKDCWETLKHPGFRNALWHNKALMSLAWKELKHSCSKNYFFESASRLIEGLSLQQLRWTKRIGIRAQLINARGELVEDLIIERTARSIHILNVVSPGMTSALAFAQWFSDRLDNNLHWKMS